MILKKHVKKAAKEAKAAFEAEGTENNKICSSMREKTLKEGSIPSFRT